MLKKQEAKTKIVLVNKDDQILGYEEKIASHKNPVRLHRAISVVIFDKDKVLLQKRSGSKLTWPGYWTNPCCSHPFIGESYIHAAKRRLKEEMGIETRLKKVFSFIYECKYNQMYGEHELDHVFVGEYSGVVKPDTNEASDYKWMSSKKLAEDINRNPGKYTPWFKTILQKLEII